MNRREFFSAIATAPLLTSAFSGGAAGLDGARPSGKGFRVTRFEYAEATIPELQAALKSGRETAVSLAKKYLERIEDIDRKGPTLNSMIELNRDALAIARSLDRERKAKGPRGPLHGVPIVLKDNIDTHDRMMTTAGSLALLGSIAPRDSFVAEKLRSAGAVILGKTNLSEWANFRSSRSTSGWSGRGGQTRNPYMVRRNPSGSSSGSGAAVSANLCAAAIGTETNGSIVSPSSFCGIVGLKPTVGLVGRSGIIPIAHSQDTAGPMARTVTDAAVLLGALTGVDDRDSATERSRGKSFTDYTQFLDPRGLQGARIGIARNLVRHRTETGRVFEEAIAAMKSAGAVIIDPVDIPTQRDLGDGPFQVMLYEFKADLNAYLAGLVPNVPVKTLQDVIAFNESNREKEMPYFGQEIFHRAQEKGPLTDKAYLETLQKNHRLSRDEGIDAVMTEHRLHAIVAPTTGPAHVTDYVYGDRDTGGSSTLAAVAGYPNITVPAGAVFDLPVGISFFGRAWTEPTLLKIAFAFEQLTKARRVPRFVA